LMDPITKAFVTDIHGFVAARQPALTIHGDLAGYVSERRKVPLTWENVGVEANILL